MVEWGMERTGRTIALAWEYSLSGLKYLLAVVMLLSAFQTMTAPLTPMDGALGFIYSSRVTLVILGALFAAAALSLLYGKIRRSRKWTGRGLMNIYLCFLFATIIQGAAYAWMPGYWIPNAIVTVIVGLLWLRWRMKTAYINPKHFRRIVNE